MLAFRHLQAAYFKFALTEFSREEYAAVAPCAEKFYDEFIRIRDQQAAQAVEITNVLGSFGAQTVQPCTYTFPVSTAFGFVNLGRIITGVYLSALQGLVPYWTTKEGADYSGVAGECNLFAVIHWPKP